MGGTAAMGHMRAAGGLYYDAGTTVAVSVDGSDLRRVTPPNTISEYCAAAACGLTFPRDVLRTASGKVYVADTDGDRIVELTNPVAPVVVAGMSGSASVVADVAIASARFTGPSGIAMDPYGDLIVVDHDSHCVLRVRF